MVRTKTHTTSSSTPVSRQKKKFGIGGLDPLVVKIIFILGIAFAVIVVMAIVVNLAAPKRLGNADLISLAQTQQEIIRVADAGNAGAVRQTTKNLAITTEYTLRTQQAALLDTLAKQGVKVKDKELGLKQDASTDLKLKEAQQTSTYDTTFSQIIEDELRSYANNVSALHDRTASESQRDFLSTNFTQAQLLISQVPYTQQALGNN